LYTVSHEKDQKYYSFIKLANVCRSSKFLHPWIQQEICYKTIVMFPPHINYQVRMYTAIQSSLIILPLQTYIEIRLIFYLL